MAAKLIEVSVVTTAESRMTPRPAAERGGGVTIKGDEDEVEEGRGSG